MGVYLAHDFGHEGGCPTSQAVFVKAWTRSRDPECITETRVYRVFQWSGMPGTPKVLENGRCNECRVTVIVMEHLGPTLETVRQLLPGKKFTEEMVLAVAIEMVSISPSSTISHSEIRMSQLDRYSAFHAAGILHNGAKPENICISPALDESNGSIIYAIDFGSSHFFDENEPLHLPSELGSVAGNLLFMSALTHIGVSTSNIPSRLFHVLTLLLSSIPTVRSRISGVPPGVPFPRLFTLDLQ